MIKPAGLQPGDSIAVVSPGSPISEQALQRGVTYLQKNGYRVQVGKNALLADRYLAGADKQRADDLNSAFANPEIKAVFCSRGGYGSARLLPYLDFDCIADNAKVFVGYSDVTAIQMAMVQRADLVSFSGPMAAVEMADNITDFTSKHFWNTITGASGAKWHYAGAGETKVMIPGRASGKLLGGCLSILMSMLDTGYLPDFRHALLFVEDIAEAPYKIDRYLMQLKLSGILDELSGIVFGRFVDCSAEQTKSFSIDEIIRTYVADLAIPVVTGWPYGHVRDIYTMPVGLDAVLDADNLRLEFAQAAVTEGGR